MSLEKIQVEKLLDRLPEGLSLEDISYHIYVLGRIQRGLEALRDGRVHGQDDVEKRIGEWLPRA
ncbi:MAG: hypothetical protein JXP34_24015 [Planctomycetes bacterium]|nr:hypothetical protein [Planctomycetota bacterium]